MVRTELLTFLRLLLLGSKPSDTSMRTSSIREDLSWRFKETDAKKDNQSWPGRSTTVRIRDGSLSTVKTTEVINKLKEKITTSDL